MRKYLIGFIITLLAMTFVALSYFLGIYKREKRLMKYIPSGIAAVLTFTLFIKAFYFSEGFEGLVYLPFGIIMAIIFVVSLTVALITGLVNLKKYK